MNKMIVSNLVYRPLRSIISVIAVALEVTLILLIVGFALGTLNDSKARQKGIGADVMVKPPGSSNFLAFSSAPVSVKVGDILLKQPHVTVVSPMVLQTTNNIEVLYGIDVPTFEAMGGPLRYLEGHGFQQPYDMIVDEYYAASHKLHAGDKVRVLDHDFHVSGIIPQGRGSRRFIPIATLQDLTGAENKATMFYVKLDDPKNADAVAQQIKTIPGMENYNTMSIGEWLALMSADNIPPLAMFIHIVIGIAMVIGFIVIFQSMYTAVLERTREIGILKSMGASKMFIVRIILRETLLLAVAGIIAGIGISLIAAQAIRYKLPTVPVEFTGGWILRAAIIAIIGSMIGAIYPAFKAAQKDPIDALAYE
jgi:putative ABC transport system permease protein